MKIKLLIKITLFLISIYYLYKLYNKHIYPLLSKLAPKLSGFQQYIDLEQNQEIKEIKQEIKQLNEEIHEENHEDKIKRLIRAFEIYYNGVPDKYDKNGNLSPGLPPNSNKAIAVAKELIQYDYYHGYILLAKIYHFGMHGIDPDIKKAVKIYEFIMTNDVNFPLNVRILASELYNRVYPTRNHNIETENDRLNRMINNDRPVRNNRRLRQFENNIINDIRNYQLNDDTPPENIANDLQNVHDHAVVSNVNNILNNVVKNKGDKYDNAEKEFLELIKKKPKNQLTANTIIVMDKIRKDNELRQNFTDMWGYIGKHQNSSNIKDALFTTLASGVEHGAPVCNTGIKSRIADSLSGMDESVSIKPTWAIKEEMFQTAAKIREDEYNKLSHMEKSYVDDVNPNNFQTDFYNDLKNNVSSRLRKTYLEPDLLTSLEYEKTLQEVITGFN